MLNLFHTKFDHKAENGDEQSVPKFGGMFSQKMVGISHPGGRFVQGTHRYKNLGDGPLLGRIMRGHIVRVSTCLSNTSANVC
jgi:hypothetical protein